jgi:hypothetical protein
VQKRGCQWICALSINLIVGLDLTSQTSFRRAVAIAAASRLRLPRPRITTIEKKRLLESSCSTFYTMLGARLSLVRQAVGRRGGLLAKIPKRSYAAVTDLRQLPQPGDKLHGFTVQRAKSVPELQLAAIQFQHDKTGADYIHIARDDKNNVFAIGFKTNPNDDTGVPHILEHTTLCGSEKCGNLSGKCCGLALTV